MGSLFDLPGDDWDPLYLAIRDSDHPSAVETRQFVDGLWGRYESLADPHFKNEIGSQFQPRFWEMYLACTLLAHSFKISSSDVGPDFCMSVGDMRIWIEAIAPGPGAPCSADRVPDIVLISESGIAQSVPDEQIVIRYCGAIKEKFRKYSEYLSNGIIGSSDPYVIAINSGTIRLARPELNIPRIVKAVFPIGHLQVTMSRETGEVVDTGYQARTEIPKASGAAVETTIFIDPGFAGISAVLYSPIDAVNQTERMGDDFVFVHNPLASNPIPRDLIRMGIEYWAEDRGENYELCDKNWADDAR